MTNTNSKPENQQIESTSSEKTLKIPEFFTETEKEKRILSIETVDILGGAEIKNNAFVNKPESVIALFGIDKKTKEPIVLCPQVKSAKSFSWEFLVSFAIKNGLLKNFISSTGGEKND